MSRFICRASLMAACAAAATLVQAAGPHYRIHILEGQSGEIRYYPVDINNAGAVAGTRHVGDGSPGQAFLYQDGVVRMLGTLGGLDSYAAGLNERGDVTGNSGVSNNEWRGFIYRDGLMTEFPGPPDKFGNQYAGIDINNQRHVLGNGRQRSDFQSRPFIYDGQQSRFLAPTPELFIQDANAINDRDEIVGSAMGRAYYYYNGELKILPSPYPPPIPLPGYWENGAVDINNTGQILVQYHDFDRRVAYIYQDGTYTELPHRRFTGIDMNEHGWVLGWSGSRSLRPKIFMDGTFYDLNSRILRGEDKDWKIERVYAMNDLGQFIGLGTSGAFIATPIPEPGATVLMLAGLGLVGMVVRRRRDERA